jgi:hypothetical protein
VFLFVLQKWGQQMTLPISSCKDGAGASTTTAATTTKGATAPTVVDRDRFAILTYEQVTRVDSVLNEMVALEGRGNFPALELKLKDLLTAVKDRLVQEGIKVKHIFLFIVLFNYCISISFSFIVFF